MQQPKSEGAYSPDIVDLIILVVGIAAFLICYNFPI